jgi:hypothetical protein
MLLNKDLDLKSEQEELESKYESELEEELEQEEEESELESEEESELESEEESEEKTDEELDVENKVDFISDDTINEIENRSYTFEENYSLLLNEYEVIKHYYDTLEEELKKFNESDNFREKYNYFYNGLNNYIKEFDHVIDYTIDLIRKEINKDQLDSDLYNIHDYIKTRKNYKMLSDKLLIITDLKINNYYNNLIVDTLLLSKWANYTNKLTYNFVENNSKKGNYIIVNLTYKKFVSKSKEINVDKLDEFKKLFESFVSDNEDAYNACYEIWKEINEEKNKNSNILSTFENNIESSLEYYNKMSDYTFQTYLNEFKEPTNQYNTECPICLNEIKEEKCITNCGHVYCVNCIKTYLDNDNNRCPMCKKDL